VYEERSYDHHVSFFSWLFGQHRHGSDVAVDFTVKLPKNASLREVKTVSADIDIEGVGGDGRMKSVSGDIRIRDAAGPVEISTVSGEVAVDRSASGNIGTTSGCITLRDVTVNGRVHSVSGDIRMERHTGSADFHTTSGSITIERAGTVTAKTISGDINLRDLTVNGQLSSTSGNIRVERAAGELVMRTLSGDVNVSAATVKSASSTNGTMDITVGAVSGPMLFTSISGNIRLHLPSGVNADIEMNTISGRMETTDRVPIVATEITPRGIKGRIGSGGTKIALRTTSGGIALAE
jgi:DUF4097 and DUF4098 domain-containing protein YvlB